MAKIYIENLIVKETDNYLFINKPPLISSLDDRAGENVNILRLVKQINDDFQLCHRLDRETSGILLIAKHSEAYRHAAMSFEHRKVNKIYHAIVDGIHDFNIMHVNLPILPLPIGIVKIDKTNGKQAETFFKTLEVFKKHTLVECRPITGRMHQIRIHLATLNASIVADEQYGGKIPHLSEIKKKYKHSGEDEEPAMIKRFALHAQTIAFEDLNGELLQAEAPYPKDFEVLYKLVAKNV